MRFLSFFSCTNPQIESTIAESESTSKKNRHAIKNNMLKMPKKIPSYFDYDLYSESTLSQILEKIPAILPAESYIPETQDNISDITDTNSDKEEKNNTEDIIKASRTSANISLLTIMQTYAHSSDNLDDNQTKVLSYNK
jgi:hypothetical protein